MAKEVIIDGIKYIPVPPTPSNDIQHKNAMRERGNDIQEGKRDWEILRFQYENTSNCNFVVVKEDGNCYYDSPMGSLSGTLEAHLNPDSKWIINQVKRLSDGVVFSVGDKIGWGTDGSYETVIAKFEIQDGRLKFDDEKRGSHLNLCDFENAYKLHKKLPPKEVKEGTKVLFTTEDGVDIKEGDDFCYIDHYDNWKINWLYKINTAYGWFHPLDKTLKTFSTKESAEQYINLHKKKYSKQDIINLL